MFDRTFSTVSVRKYTPILTEQRDVMMDQLAKTNSANPQGFDIYPLMVKLTFDVTRLSFGAGVKAQTTKEGADYANRFERWMQCAAKMSSFLQLFGKWSYIFIQPVVKQWKEDGDALFGLVRAERARVERGESRISILDDAMAIVQSEKVPATMTDRQLELVFMSLLFGGHDTTSALLSFTLYELAKRPDLQTEIRREVEDVCGSSPIDNLEALEKCKVLNACIKESLRWVVFDWRLWELPRLPVPFFRKTPSAPFGATRNIFEGFDFQYTSFDGKPKKIKFCKGDRLITYIWGIQNYPGYWNTDPSKWSPERFYEDPTGGTTAGLYAYSPFGQGPRRCLGERLGLGEARLCLASILRRWQVDLVPETDWKYEETYHGEFVLNVGVLGGKFDESLVFARNDLAEQGHGQTGRS